MSFVEDLTKLSDIILFSGAIPGQGGTNHVNEQWHSYWIEKFLRFGYVAIDCIRPLIWNIHQLDVCYRSGLFLYVNRNELYRYPELQEYYLKHRDDTVYDYVHPEMWISRLIQFQNMAQNFQAYIEKLNQK